MTTVPNTLTVIDNAVENRFEVHVDDQVATLDYVRRDDHIVLVYMRVPKELEGRGIGGRISKFAFDDARSRGINIAVHCPFVTSWVARHPEYDDLVIERE